MTQPAPLVSDGPGDEARRRSLRRMRAVATGLLLVAAMVFVTTLDRDGVWGFVNAGAEASMVGAIADWFAVTALFRHPLGLPVPHTALVPKRKAELGRGLESFVADNFLQEPVLRGRLESAEPARRLGEWLEEESHARRVVDEASHLVRRALARLADEDVRSLVEHGLLPRLHDEAASPVLGSLLEEVVRDGAHHGVVDLVLEEGHRWLVAHQETFTDVLAERAPWWAPERLNEAVTARVHIEALRWVDDIRRDPHHHARDAFDSLLTQLAHDLLHDPETQARAERLKGRLLDQPRLIEAGMSLWSALSRALDAALVEADGPVRQRAVEEVMSFGRTLLADSHLRRRVDDRVADLVVFAVERYGSELTAVITHTIDRWDGAEAARRIELHVGRDLQFIRVNGTLVGGLVGLLIHAVAVGLG